jgi:hypothetical protein
VLGVGFWWHACVCLVFAPTVLLGWAVALLLPCGVAVCASCWCMCFPGRGRGIACVCGVHVFVCGCFLSVFLRLVGAWSLVGCGCCPPPVFWFCLAVLVLVLLSGCCLLAVCEVACHCLAVLSRYVRIVFGPFPCAAAVRSLLRVWLLFGGCCPPAVCGFVLVPWRVVSVSAAHVRLVCLIAACCYLASATSPNM